MLFLLMMKIQKWFQSTIFAVVLTYMIKLQLIQIAKLMFLQHQMRSRTVYRTGRRIRNNYLKDKKMLYEIQMNLSWRGWKLIN